MRIAFIVSESFMEKGHGDFNQLVRLVTSELVRRGGIDDLVDRVEKQASLSRKPPEVSQKLKSLTLRRFDSNNIAFNKLLKVFS